MYMCMYIYPGLAQNLSLSCLSFPNAGISDLHSHIRPDLFLQCLMLQLRYSGRQLRLMGFADRIESVETIRGPFAFLTKGLDATGPAFSPPPF